MSRMLNVSRSGFYAWLSRKPSRHTQEDERLKIAIKIAHIRPVAGLIHHSDRGSQYCAHDYRKLLKQFKMKASMSRKDNCYDNAPMESFWGSLKNELVHHCRYETRDEAKASIQEYIKIFYNRQRRHSRLGYMVPAMFALNYNKQQKVA